MRLVFVADAPRIGGAERFLLDVAAGALAAGHEVTVIAPQDELLDQVRSRGPALRAVRAGSDNYAAAPTMTRRVRALLPAAHDLAGVIRAASPDLLHINNGGYPGSDLCRLTPMLARVHPTVMSVHSIPWERAHSNPHTQAVVDRALWRHLDGVIAATRVVGSALETQRGMPPELFYLVPYGMPAPPVTAEAAALRARLCPDGELLVGMIAATAEAGKGHDVLLEAMGGVREPAHAVVVGADPGARFRTAPRITLAGRVDAVAPYLHAIDVLVVPSTQWESLPLVVLEAMAAGKPVFASRLAGIPEAVSDGETGRLLPPGEPDALASALEAAARDRESLVTMGNAGRARWERSYSPERMLEGVLAAYDDVLAARRSRRWNRFGSRRPRGRTAAG